MNKANGFIVLHRKMLDWEWHDNLNTLSTFIHILLGANHEDGIAHGVPVKRGQLLTSLPELAKMTGQTEKQVRVSLSHLEMTGEVTGYSTNRYRIITVVKYDEYQDKGRQNGRQRADNRADKGQAEGQQYNNINNINNKTNKSLTRFIVPTLDEIKTYIQEINSQVDPEEFYDYYQQCGWVLKGGQKMKDWKAAIRNWGRRRNNGQYGRDQKDAGKPEGEHQSKYAWLRDTVIHC